MISSSPCTTRSGSRGSVMQAANRPATSRRRSTSRKTSSPPSDERWPPSKRAITGLPPTGDRPGSAGVVSTLAGMEAPDRQDWRQHPHPTLDQGLVPCPPTLVNHSG